MKRSALHKYLRKSGAAFLRHGGDHDIWEHRGNGTAAAVPRGKAVRGGTVRDICKQLGIPRPPSVH